MGGLHVRHIDDGSFAVTGERARKGLGEEHRARQGQVERISPFVETHTLKSIPREAARAVDKDRDGSKGRSCVGNKLLTNARITQISGSHDGVDTLLPGQTCGFFGQLGGSVVMDVHIGSCRSQSQRQGGLKSLMDRFDATVVLDPTGSPRLELDVAVLAAP